MKKNPRILIVCSMGESLLNFRGDMIKALLNEKFDVYCTAPHIKEKSKKTLLLLGAKYTDFPLQRTGLNPLKDLKSIKNLISIIKQNEIDIVFPYTIKPVIYASIAADRCKVPVISLITGLGFTFTGATFKARMLQKISEKLYRYALRKNKLVIFQNVDDENLFRDKKILTSTNHSTVINGSGINLEKYKFRTRRVLPNDTIKFVLVARLMPEKGVRLYLEAAEQIKSNGHNAEFHLVGSTSDNHASSLSPEEVKILHDKDIIIHHGYVFNIEELLDQMHVFVLPTYYREGVPRSILEALSLGMPIITTDTPGARETIKNNKNGIIIPPRKLKPLIKALIFFLENPEKIEHMGLKSYELAKEKFDVHIINQQIIQYINQNLKKQEAKVD